MTRSLVLTLSLVGLLSGGFLVLDEIGAGSPPGGMVEEQVDANLVRVRVNGTWEEFPLIPLADHLCTGGNRLFDRYCPDSVIAPEERN